jgi:hypothetical protein
VSSGTTLVEALSGIGSNAADGAIDETAGMGCEDSDVVDRWVKMGWRLLDATSSAASDICLERITAGIPFTVWIWISLDPPVNSAEKHTILPILTDNGAV